MEAATTVKNTASELMPRILGAARGFFVRACVRTPSTARQAFTLDDPSTLVFDSGRSLDGLEPLLALEHPASKAVTTSNPVNIFLFSV